MTFDAMKARWTRPSITESATGTVPLAPTLPEPPPLTPEQQAHADARLQFLTQQAQNFLVQTRSLKIGLMFAVENGELPPIFRKQLYHDFIQAASIVQLKEGE